MEASRSCKVSILGVVTLEDIAGIFLQICAEAELLQEGLIFLLHLFARAILLMKNLKIEETKATYIIFNF